MVHAAAADTPEAQKDPGGHRVSAVLPAGQKFPPVQVAMVDGVLQNDPAGQRFCTEEPAGQYLVKLHAVAADTPEAQKVPAGHT